MSASTWGNLRRRVLTPSISQTTLSKRGFYVKDGQSRELLETVGRMFLEGYGFAAEARTCEDAEEKLETLPRQFRGFAYEGAGMGFAVRDGLPFGGHWVSQFLQGRAAEHVYMVYVGVGWAMARLPRLRWAKVTSAASDPVLRWLLLDGYGFHQAYFHTDKYVRQQYREPGFPWPSEGPAPYADRVIDQGIGRALWFVCGTDPNRVADAVDAFPPDRRADLYSGAGLAATYAGGVDEAELLIFRQRARAYMPGVAQASAFAATARVRAGLVLPHTGLATRVLCAATPEQAAVICADTTPLASEGGEMVAYELWRTRIADRLTSLHRTSA
jgi:hypothetical protein